jgi:hypothetical protein
MSDSNDTIGIFFEVDFVTISSILISPFVPKQTEFNYFHKFASHTGDITLLVECGSKLSILRALRTRKALQLSLRHDY